MPRLIDADALKKLRDDYIQGRIKFDGDEYDLIDKCPTIEAEPVKHGRWLDHMVRDWRCSECGEPINKVRNVDGYCYDDKPNYCPNCGAKMDGGSNEN